MYNVDQHCLHDSHFSPSQLATSEELHDETLTPCPHIIRRKFPRRSIFSFRPGSEQRVLSQVLPPSPAAAVPSSETSIAASAASLPRPWSRSSTPVLLPDKLLPLGGAAIITTLRSASALVMSGGSS